MNLSDIEITEVSVYYGETKSLPEYSNVKPGYSLKAAVKPDQDPEEVKAALSERVKAWVWEDCDTALEREGRKAHFWTGPRYDLRVLGDDWLVVIVPAEAELPKIWSGIQCPRMDWRLEALREYAKDTYGKLQLLDLSDGNLEALPDVQEYEVVWLSHDNATYCLLLPADFDIKLLPDVWQNYHRTRYTSHIRLAANFLPWITEQAAKKEATLIDALDGDLSKLPDLTPKDAPVTEIEPDMDEPIEDDDDWEEDEDNDEDEDED